MIVEKKSLKNLKSNCQIFLRKYVKHILSSKLMKLGQTQVGSPAVRLRLARFTAWVKRWSEAMDFLQTIFKTNISGGWYV